MRKGPIIAAAVLTCAGAPVCLLSGPEFGFYAGLAWVLYGAFVLPMLLAEGFLSGLRGRGGRARTILAFLAADAALFLAPFCIASLAEGWGRYGLLAIVPRGKMWSLIVLAALPHGAVLLWRSIAEARRRSGPC